MKVAPIQPEVTKVTTQHTVMHKGYAIVIKGYHEVKYDPRSKMSFSFYWGNSGLTFGAGKFNGLRDKLDQVVAKIEADADYKAKSKAFHDSYNSLTVSEKIASPNFAYSRFQSNSDGNYYKIYWRSNLSPTSVWLVGGCSEAEWETISKETGNANNYYSPTENRN